MKSSLLKYGAIGVMAFGVSATFAKIDILADRSDALYNCGETATFFVTHTPEANLAPTGEVAVVIRNAANGIVFNKKYPITTQAQTFRATVSLSEPGFAMCEAKENGSKKSVLWGVGFDPEKIRVASKRPADFDAYWDGEVARLEREVPLDAKIVERTLPANSPSRDYDVSFATFNGKRVTGVLSVPKNQTKGPYPVCVHIPGAGPGSGGWKTVGNQIRFVMNVHTFATTTDEKERNRLYKEQNKMFLAKYGVPYQLAGASVSREEYFFHDALLGINRAVDWIAKHPLAKRDDITYTGSSQGGGMGYMLLALNKNFRRGVLMVSALCDHSASSVKRNPGWPWLTHGQKTAEGRAMAEKIAPYFDAAHFAPRIKIPMLTTVGFVDRTCDPSSVYAAFNALGSKEKEMLNVLGVGHANPHHVRMAGNEFLSAKEGKRAREIKAVLLHLGYNMWCDWIPDGVNIAGIKEGLPDKKLRCRDENWREVTDYAIKKGMNMLIVDLGEGVIYPSHPELAIEGSWSVEKLRVEVERLRKAGIEVVPKLNFSTTHNGWLKQYRRMVSTPQYYKIVEDLIADVAKMFNHTHLIHIGMDEETATHQNNSTRNHSVIVRKPLLWEYDFLHVVKTCQKNGFRPMVWSDYFVHHPDFIAKCPKSVIMINWYYDERNRGFSPEGNATPDGDIVNTFFKLRDAGFDQILCGSNYIGWIRKREECGADDVIGRTVRFGRTEIPGDHTLGYLMAPWRDLKNQESVAWNKRAIDLFADALNGKIPRAVSRKNP